MQLVGNRLASYGVLGECCGYSAGGFLSHVLRLAMAPDRNANLPVGHDANDLTPRLHELAGRIGQARKLLR